MASVNKAIIIGHLGRDPEVRYMPSGDAVTTISVATSEHWTDKAGEKQEQVEWHRVTMFGKTAEIAGEYLKKGSLVYVEGRLQTKKWTDKEGTERYTTEIRCDRMQMLGSKSGGSSSEPTDAPAGGTTANAYKNESGGSQKRRPPPQGKGGNFDDLEDDIPF